MELYAISLRRSRKKENLGALGLSDGLITPNKN